MLRFDKRVLNVQRRDPSDEPRVHCKMNLDYLNQWLGREQITESTVPVETANLMQATLDRDPSFSRGDELPPAWHWLFFHQPARGSELGIEGHPELGGLMPPVSFGDGEPPRRMWAGGNMLFERPILLGDAAVKRSTVKSITPKEGRSGGLVFVVVEHEVSVDGRRCIREDQTIVYREPVKTGSGETEPAFAPTVSEFSAEYLPDPIMLFRYSALTFNGHRIHYDVDFCRDHEGYPDLVVHGPLTATLVLDLFHHQFPDQRITSFEYRGRSPLFNPNPFTVHGQSDGQAWASNHLGQLSMSAQVNYCGKA